MPVVLLILAIVAGALWWNDVFTPADAMVERTTGQILAKHEDPQRSNLADCMRRTPETVFLPLIKGGTDKKGDTCGDGLGFGNGRVCTVALSEARHINEMWDKAHERKACLVFLRSGDGLRIYPSDRPDDKKERYAFWLMKGG